MAKLVIVAALLLAIWVTLAGNLAGDTVVVGVLAAVVSTFLFRDVIAAGRWLGWPERLRDRDAAPRRLSARLRRLAWVLAFGPVYLWKVVQSGLGMAFLALRPSVDFWPGIVRVDGKLNTVSGTALFANLLTLTPGTLTIDYDEKADALYVHWIDVTGYGEADFDRRVTSGLRVWMKRIEA